jgi:hypothetical protein
MTPLFDMATTPDAAETPRPDAATAVTAKASNIAATRRCAMDERMIVGRLNV